MDEGFREESMKTRMMSLAVMFTLLLALSPASPAQGDRHPYIQGAIHSLENARHYLKEAAHDFGGHREDALKATDEAIHQLQICMQYDKK
jgi:hypothetical protein